MIRRDPSKTSASDITHLRARRYSTWRQFFGAHGNEQIVIRYHNERNGFITVEELYAHLKSRLLEEVSKEAVKD